MTDGERATRVSAIVGKPVGREAGACGGRPLLLLLMLRQRMSGPIYTVPGYAFPGWVLHPPSVALEVPGSSSITARQHPPQPHYSIQWLTSSLNINLNIRGIGFQREGWIYTFSRRMIKRNFSVRTFWVESYELELYSLWRWSQVGSQGPRWLMARAAVCPSAKVL